MKRIIPLFIVFFLVVPLASMAAEPAWWTQMKKACVNSGGRAAYDYNTWVTQGCICNGSPSGQPTCSGGSSGGASSSGDPAANMIIGAFTGNQQQFAIGAGGFIGAAIGDALRGDPAAEARQRAAQQAAAEAAEAERRRVEEETFKRHEEMKNRLLGNMMNVGDSSQLGLMGNDSSQLALMGGDSGPGLGLMTDDLKVREIRGAFGEKELKPVIGDAGTGAIKPDKDAEKDSAQARKGFDTAGKMMGAKLPAAPNEPSTKPVSPAKFEKMNVLKATLKKNEDEEKALKAQLEKLRRSPAPDETAMKELQKKIIAKEDEKKNIEKEMEDLTAADPDEPASNQSSTTSSRASQ